MNKILPLLFLLVTIQGRALAQQGETHDSLVYKSYAYLIERLEQDGNPRAAASYAAAYRNKAIAEKNDKELAGAYKALLHQAEGLQRRKYADSMVDAARKSRNTDLLGSAYLTKGIVLYDQKKYQEALDEYLIADELLDRGNDEYLKKKLRFNIALIKYYLGFYKEAEAIFAECVEHFKSDGGTPYLSSLHSLGLCYTSLGKYDLASETNRLGIKEAIMEGNRSFIAYFKHAQGINLYFLKDYKAALRLLENVLPEISQNRHRASEMVAYLYMAKCHLASNHLAEAMPLLQKIDTAFLIEDYMRPDLREAYEHLIDYHKKKGNLEKQLQYTNRLLHADSVIEKNFRHLSGKIQRQYNNKELVASKKAIEEQLLNQERGNRILMVVVVAAVTAVATLLRRRIKKKKTFENKAKEDLQDPIEKQEKGHVTEEIGLSKEVVETLLNCLLKFESSKKFLEKDLTLAKLAASFKSNPKYVAKVIVLHSGMRYIDYTNGLKVQYLVTLLTENRQIRKYTLKALANEAGFNTAQHLNRAFVKLHGSSVTEFIEKLKNEVEPDSPTF